MYMHIEIERWPGHGLSCRDNGEWQLTNPFQFLPNNKYCSFMEWAHEFEFDDNEGFDEEDGAVRSIDPRHGFTQVCTL